MRFLRTGLFVTALTFAATVMAADPASTDYTSSGPSGYVGLSGGLDSVNSGPLQLNGVSAKAKFKDGWALVGTAGYKWDQVLRTELELSHRENNAKDLNANTTPLFGKKDDTALMANILLDLPTGGRLTPYIGGGIGIDWVNFDQIHAAGSSVYDGSNNGKFAWQGIAGVAYAISTNWQLLGEVRIKGSNNHAYPGSVAGTQVTQYNDRSRDVLIGVRYSFGGAPAAPAQAPAAPMPAPMATQAAPPPPPAVPEKFLVFFDFDKSNLRDDTKKIVAQAAEYTKTNGKTTITATGHTDTSGTAAYNMALSERRAQAVQKELERLGIPAGEIVVHWKGKSEPLIQTGDGVKEPQNRRVEIVIE